MSFCITSDLIAEGNLGNSINEDQLNPHIEMGEILLRKLISDDSYDLYKGYEESTSASEKRIYRLMTKAETYLALSVAMPALNIETQGSGIVRSKGYDASRSELLSQNEVQKLSTYFYQQAVDILDGYLIQPEPNEDDIEESLNLGDSNLIAL